MFPAQEKLSKARAFFFFFSLDVFKEKQGTSADGDV